MLYDQGKYKELYKTNIKVNPLDFPGYDEKIDFLQKKTGLNELLWSLVAKSMKQKLLLVSWIHVF